RGSDGRIGGPRGRLGRANRCAACHVTFGRTFGSHTREDVMRGSTRRWPVVAGLLALACICAGAVDPQAANYPHDSPHFVQSAAHRRFNPFEHAFTRSNIATLGQAWTGTYGSSAADESSPVIAGNTAFIAGADGRISAFNLQGCFGARCDPLWTGSTRNDITA